MRLDGLRVVARRAVQPAASSRWPWRGGRARPGGRRSAWRLVVGAACVAGRLPSTPAAASPTATSGSGRRRCWSSSASSPSSARRTSQLERVTWPGRYAALRVGLLACALLVANNLRDIPTDTVAGKRTLAVRLGDERPRVLYALLVAAAAAAVVAVAVVTTWWALLGLGFLVRIAGPTRDVLKGATGPALIPVLAATGISEVIWAALVAAPFSSWVSRPPKSRGSHPPWSLAWTGGLRLRHSRPRGRLRGGCRAPPRLDRCGAPRLPRP